MRRAAGQRAVVVRGAAEATAVLLAAAGQPVLLLSAPAAGASLGPAGWQALLARAAAEVPGAPFDDALCCGAFPGPALVALRAGCRCLVLDGAVPAFPQVAAAAAEIGATVLPARPPALDLGSLDLRRAHGTRVLSEWLTCNPHDIPRANG